jgi:hypothetical protein
MCTHTIYVQILVSMDNPCICGKYFFYYTLLMSVHSLWHVHILYIDNKIIYRHIYIRKLNASQIFASPQYTICTWKLFFSFPYYSARLSLGSGSVCRCVHSFVWMCIGHKIKFYLHNINLFIQIEDIFIWIRIRMKFIFYLCRSVHKNKYSNFKTKIRILSNHIAPKIWRNRESWWLKLMNETVN